MKRALRRAFARRRAELGERAARSERAAVHVRAAFEPLVELGRYAAMGTEADPSGLAASRDAYPCIEGDELVLRWCSSRELRPAGPWSILEPPPSAVVAAPPPGLILVPGLAFDRQGGRLGYGKGFYDRLLRRIRRDHPSVLFIGFGFATQLSDEPLPQHDADERLDGFASEDGLLRFPA